MKKFIVKNNPGFNFDKKKAQEYGERLEYIKNVYGLLTADIVLSDAENEESPYHNEFCWDDTEAAHKWRKHTARNLIGCIHVEIENYEPIVRNFECVIYSEENNERVYEDIEVIAMDDYLMSQVMDKLKNDIRRLRIKYKVYQHLEKYFNEIDKIII